MVRTARLVFPRSGGKMTSPTVGSTLGVGERDPAPPIISAQSTFRFLRPSAPQQNL